jgi:hypothetical protein
MKRVGTAALAVAVVGMCGLSFGADKPGAKPPATASQATTKSKPETPYDKLVDAYMNNNFDELSAELKTLTMIVNNNKLTRDQRINVEYIRKAFAEERPNWWGGTKSAANSSFQSTIWGRNVMTNYVPADNMGMEQVVGVQDGRLVMVVTWRPTYVDNPRPADGALAKTLGVTKGDIGEVVVWHELGHLYMTSALRAESVIELYTKYRVLASHLQEFFADMTAIAHSSAHARRIAMVLRLDAIDPPFEKYNEIEPHTRGSHAIGSMFLFEVLSNRAKWPDVHLPAAAPEGDVELQTIIYMYEHFNKQWTFEEDKALRDWATKTVREKGDRIFHSKGMIPLPDNNTFSLMEAQDREFQKKRNAWIKEKLTALIAKGEVDKPQPKPKNVVTVNGRVVKMGGQRIETPDY